MPTGAIGRNWGEVSLFAGTQTTLTFTVKNAAGNAVVIEDGDTFELWLRNTRTSSDVFRYENDDFTIVDADEGRISVVVQAADTSGRYDQVYVGQLWKTNSNVCVGYGKFPILRSARSTDSIPIIDNLPLNINGILKGTGTTIVSAVAGTDYVLPNTEFPEVSLAGLVYYVATDGSDTNNNGLSPTAPFLTLSHAAAIATVAGTLVSVGAGTFALGSVSLRWSDGVSVVGAGIDVTTITSSRDAGTSEVQYRPGSNSLHQDFTLASDPGIGTSMPFGCWDSLGFVGVIARRLKITGQSDGIYLRTLDSGGTVPVELTTIDCQVEAVLDTVNIFNAVASGGSKALKTWHYNLNLTVVADPAGTGVCRGFPAASGTHYLYGGSISVSGNSTTTCAGITTYARANVSINVYGTKVRTSSTGSATPYDLSVLLGAINVFGAADYVTSNGAVSVFNGASAGGSIAWGAITGTLSDQTDLVAALAAKQTLDATLTALAAQNWAANAFPIGSGSDTVAQVMFAANTFPARSSTGNLVPKTITDAALSVLDDTTVAAMVDTLGGASSTGTGGLVRATLPTFAGAIITLANNAALVKSAAGNVIFGLNADNCPEFHQPDGTLSLTLTNGGMQVPASYIVDPGGVGKTFYGSHSQSSYNEGATDYENHSYTAKTHSFYTGTVNVNSYQVLKLYSDGTATFGGDLSISGNLAVSGTTTTINTTNEVVADPLVKQASGNTSSDVVDIGFYGEYHPSSTTLFTGVFRDASDGKYKFFTGLQSEPTTTVNVAGTGYAVATIVANVEGNLTGTATAVPSSGITGATTVGQAVLTLSNPSAVSFLRINADNTVTARSAANTKVDLSLNNVDNTSNATERAASAALTNKTFIDSTNVDKEITTTASSATPAPTGGSLRNFFTVTALAAGATFAAPSGSPVSGNTLLIRIKDNGTSRSLAYNAIYRAIGVTLPTATVVSKTLYLACVYNSADSKWDVLGVGQEA